MVQSLSHKISAESIAHALPGCRKTGAHSWCTHCLSCGGKNFCITDKGGKPLFKCWGGCSQRDVIQALQRDGLWPEKKKRTAKIHTLTDKREMRAFIGAHEYNLKRGIPTITKHQRLYSQYQRILYAPFSAGEVAEMHLFCLAYQADVRKGKATTPKDDEMFTGFSRLVYELGVPYAW